MMINQYANNMHLSQGEKSMSWTPGWLNLISLLNSSPPQRAIPWWWRVAKYVPLGDQRTYVSVQFWRNKQENWKWTVIRGQILTNFYTANLNVFGILAGSQPNWPIRSLPIVVNYVMLVSSLFVVNLPYQLLPWEVSFFINQCKCNSPILYSLMCLCP